jgi:hypothetical protein
MSAQDLEYYRIFNDSPDSKQFGYTSGSSNPGSNYVITLNGITESIVQSYIEPYNIPVGTNESTFLSDNTYPTSEGYAWLWNDGYKVKHIKIHHVTQNGQNILPYIPTSQTISFLLRGARNAQQEYMYTPSASAHVETYVISNSTTKPQDYQLLSIQQDDPRTSFAVDSLNRTFTNYNFTATGDYTWYATSSGRIDNPVSSSGISSSIAQGYFPVNIEDFGTTQRIRGWSHANYYIGDNLGNFTGTISDPLNQFNTGSTERDYDGVTPVQRSVLPWFINAPASLFNISSSNFGTYTNQPRTVQIGPRYSGSSEDVLYDGAIDIIGRPPQVYGDAIYDGEADTGELIYFYKEDTNEILIQDNNNIISADKSNFVQFEADRNEKLVELNNAQIFTTPEGYELEIGNGEELWVYKGYSDTTGPERTWDWNYNRYLHRPYKIYMVTETGSNGLASHIKDTYIAFSSSLASSRPKDGTYIFNTVPTETIGLTASINLTSSDPFPIGGYGVAEYDEGSSVTDAEERVPGVGNDYDDTPDPSPTLRTWTSASLRLYRGTINSLGILYAEEDININDINTDNHIELTTDFSYGDIAPGTALRLYVHVHTASAQLQPPNAPLIVTDYTMSISASLPEISDLVPTYLDNILLTPEDCNPFVGNALESRKSTTIMDVDYSSDVSNPINFNQLINFTALKAAIPDSNYTSLTHSSPRYLGSKTTANDVNTSDGAVNTYGKQAVIDYERAFFAYCNQVIDLYPLVNDKTLFNIKYLIDANGNALQPNLSKFTGFDVRGTWDEGGFGRVGINQIPGSTQFDTLNGLQDIFKVAKQPIPILYSQNSANTYNSFIPIIGNPKEVSSFSAEFLQYGMTLEGSAYTSQNANDKNIQLDNIGQFVYANDYALTTASRFGEYDSTGRIYASSSIIPGNDIDPYGDNSVYGKFVADAEYTGSITTNNWSNSVQGSGGYNNVDVVTVTGNGSGAKLDVSYVDSTITSITGSSGYLGASYEEGDEVKINPGNGGEITLLLKAGDLKGDFPQPAQVTWAQPGEIYFNKDIFAINNDGISGNELSDTYTLKFEGSFISSTLWEYRTDAGGWNDSSDYNRNSVGHLQIWLERWDRNAGFNGAWVKCKMKQLKRPKIVYDFGNNQTVELDARALNGASTAGLLDNNTRYYILCKAMVWANKVAEQGKSARNAQFVSWNVKLASDEEIVSGTRYRWRSDQYFNPEHVDAPRNYWNPTTIPQQWGGGPLNPYPQGPYINISVTNAREADGTVDNALNAPYWTFVTDENGDTARNKLELVDPNGNASYANGYIQGFIPYTASESGRFPGGLEPADSNLPNFNTPWELQKNDEIRFENNELYSYKILEIIPPSENITDDGARLRITLDNPVPASVEKDFFLIRRYVEADNIVIIDKLFPYGGLSIEKQTLVGTTTDNFKYTGSRQLNPDDEDAEATQGEITLGTTLPTTHTKEVYAPLTKKANTPTGVLFPEFAIKEIDFDTDEVVRDLRDKKLIE